VIGMLNIVKRIAIVVFYLCLVFLLAISYFPAYKYPDSKDLNHVIDPDVVLVEIFFSIIVIIFSCIGFIVSRDKYWGRIINILFIVLGVVRLIQVVPLYQY
jgi:hypothetical protein